MKAVSAVIATVMLLMVTVSLVGVSYVFSSTITTTTTSSGSEQAAQLTGQLSSCMRIENINGNKVELRNCGKGIIENKSLVVTMDDVKLGASINTISEDSSGTMNVSGLWQIAPGKHNLKISNGATFALALVDVQVNKDGLVGSWSFNEGSGNKVYDTSGNGNTGNLINNPIWVSGRFGKGLQFDGINKYADIPSSTSLPIGSTGIVSFWLYRNDDGGVDGYVFQKDSHPLIYTGGGGSDLQVYWAGATGLPLLGAYTDSYNNLGTSSWHHIAISWSNSNTLIIYIDGTIWKTYSGLSLPAATNGYEFSRYSGSNYFNGIIDEVMMWNRALSPDETVMMKQII